MKKGKNVNEEIQLQLDLLVIGNLADACKASVKRGDLDAAESAFCSSISASEYLHRFPFLESKWTTLEQKKKAPSMRIYIEDRSILNSARETGVL